MVFDIKFINQLIEQTESGSRTWEYSSNYICSESPLNDELDIFICKYSLPEGEHQIAMDILDEFNFSQGEYVEFNKGDQNFDIATKLANLVLEKRVRRRPCAPNLRNAIA